MSKMSIELRTDPRCDRVLDLIASTMSDLNNDVVRFYTRLGSKARDAPISKGCDYVFLWNGYYDFFKDHINEAKMNDSKLVYLELGFTSQRNFFQADFGGVNNDSLWSNNVDFSSASDKKLKAKGDYIFVPLQVDGDTQIIRSSPKFKNMYQFVNFLSKMNYPILIRKHPRANIDPRVKEIVNKNKNMSFDTNGLFSQSLGNALCVATINSTTGIEAIESRKPVLSFGLSVYRHEGLTYCCSDNVSEVNSYLDEIKTGETSLKSDYFDIFMNCIKENQYSVTKEGVLRMIKDMGIV
jgi:hypothetical protein